MPSGQASQRRGGNAIGDGDQFPPRQDRERDQSYERRGAGCNTGAHDHDVGWMGERIDSIDDHGRQPASEEADHGGRDREVPQVACAVCRVAAPSLPIEEDIQSDAADRRRKQKCELHQRLLSRISSICSASVRSSITEGRNATSSPPAAKKNVWGTPNVPPSATGIRSRASMK